LTPAKLIAVLVLVVLIASVALGSVVTIGAGHRGVLLTYGKVEETILPEGISFITPFVNQVHAMSVQTQKISSLESSASKDLQDVSTEVTLNYKLDALEVNRVYRDLSTDYENRIIKPAISEAVKSSTAQYTAEELITKRALVKEEIELALADRISKFGGMIVQSVAITDFKFSPEFSQAIENKVTAEQKALEAQNDLKRIQIEAEQKVAIAQAEATAIQIQGDALRNNPDIVTLRYIEMMTATWDGHMPTFIGGGDNFLLGLDLNQLSSQQRTSSLGGGGV
jgi:prohibitin 2